MTGYLLRQWLCGKPHGAGTLSWASSGTTYKGQFRQGLYHGVGILHTPLHPVVSSSSASSSSHSSSGSASTTSSSGYSSSYFTSSGSSGSHTSYPTSMSSSSSSSSSFVVMQEGMWISGKMVGQAVIRYANGDLYVGQVKDGLPSGHGVRKTGHFGSQAASVYTGEWSQGVRAGYGVLDDIVRGRDVHSTLAHVWCQVKNPEQHCCFTLSGASYEFKLERHRQRQRHSNGHQLQGVGKHLQPTSAL
ncbi:phosphatidylinositol 4-phosphate 5-kinase 8-like, partial [Penaeus monodon]|uniref:phosphatidylinositol 4-phosphate 5-kinase 8-like n=1 Tax=Penaeus monodon TaxID=6687 RepID=UPI0018A7B9CB